MSDKDEYPPLLKAGFHTMTIADLRKLCVDGFSSSAARAKIMDGLEKLFAVLSAANLKAEAWVDGSFLTDKAEPADSDVVVRISGWDCHLASQEQVDLMNWVNETDLKPEYHCDCYCFVEYEGSHPLGGVGEWSRAYWIRQFGFARGMQMKGIALIALPLHD